MKSIYSPHQFLLPKKYHRDIIYREYSPSPVFSDCVHCYWELYTPKPLAEPFTYSILPDACMDIICDRQTETVFFSGTRFNVQQVTIGHEFHYIGIRFFPGCIQRTWDIKPREIIDSDFLPTPDSIKQYYIKHTKTSSGLAALCEKILTELSIAPLNRANAAMLSVFYKDDFKIADSDTIFGLSPRQLHRQISNLTGLSPKEFQKIIRFQRYLVSVKEQLLDSGYYDQSHLIKEFQAATGYTPAQYFQ